MIPTRFLEGAARAVLDRGQAAAGGDGADPGAPRGRRALARRQGEQEHVVLAAAAGVGVLPSSLAAAWSARVDDTLARATLARPAPSGFTWYGKQGRHSEHLGYLLAEMQSLHRAHPGATW